MITVLERRGLKPPKFAGLSGDDKAGVPWGVQSSKWVNNGATFYELDTELLFTYDAENDDWGDGVAGGIGGGPGAASYNELLGKPAINGRTLQSGANSPESLDLRYTHTQTIAAAEWRVVHNLNFANPGVTIYVNGEIAMADVTIESSNVVVIRFAVAVNGSVTVRS